MSSLQFLTSLVGSLAWPVVVLVIVVLFRTTIRSVLTGQVKRWRAGLSGVEVEYWELTADRARDQLPPDAEKRAAETLGGGLSGELAPVAEVAPRAAVLEAFGRIEQELRRITRGFEAPEKLERMSARQLAVVAHQHERISDESFSAVNGLTVLRNLAAHGQAEDLDTSRALEFVHLADAVLFALGQQGGGTRRRASSA